MWQNDFLLRLVISIESIVFLPYSTIFVIKIFHNKVLFIVLKEELIITNELGLHARPAAMIAKIARKAKAEIWLEKDGQKVDATSMIDILSIACQKDSKIVLEADSSDDELVFEEILKIIQEGFGE
ncbi:MAG: HPr family phosphocarrier protein [Deltaproteobacteria bacterium]|nr:MAG: HPr family phosphocarrier protein [Deltaproteobacteria bacterium]